MTQAEDVKNKLELKITRVCDNERDAEERQ